MAQLPIEDALLAALRDLPPEKKQEVLDFAVRLAVTATRPRKSMYGIWAGQFPSISDEDIAEARKEMWGGFPRERFFE
ncbi:MAG: DUF2281 domain-containing protein [Acidobacteria bacterium]|nr:DUF2281 domain-containing protein [Acidobacteriota bacterium]